MKNGVRRQSSVKMGFAKEGLVLHTKNFKTLDLDMERNKIYIQLTMEELKLGRDLKSTNQSICQKSDTPVCRHYQRSEYKLGY